ncbi:MAG: ABC transporter substrate-binding protein [Chloroflexi bacterium]|nr:ABC transporter substrate-binding protein [Chloroflexota bacterium]
MRKPIYALAALTLTVSLLLAACARPAPSPTSPAAPTTPPPTTAPAPKASPTPPPGPAETPQYGGVYKLAFHTSLRTLFPALSAATMGPVSAIFDYLMVADDKGEELFPQLAIEWKLNPDATSFTLTLRKGVKFHDGTDFNATSVKWNIEQRKAARLGDYDEVTSISIVDDYTVRLNLSTFRNTMMVPLWYTGSQVYSQTAYEKNGKDWAALNPVGTGPFKFVNYEKDQLLKTVRFDGYWQKGRPYLDGFDIHYIADTTTRVFAFLKGDVDHVTNLTPTEAKDLTSKGYRLRGVPDTVTALFPDSANTDSPFASKKVREAVEYAIDRARIASALGFGLWKPANQISIISPANIPDLKGREYDPAKAKQLLAEAGYPNGFKTSMYFRSTTATRDALVAYATNLKSVGIEVTLEPVPIAKFTQLSQDGWRGLLAEIIWETPDWLQTVYTRMSITSTISKSVLRPSGWQEVLDQAIAATDASTKKTLSQQVVRKAFDEVAVIPLMITGSPSFTQDHAHAGEPVGNGGRLSSLYTDYWLSKKGNK